MRLTTLCYIQREGQYLMLHRVKKARDENAGKWIGIGGHLESGESPEECVLREIREETGLQVTGLRLRGILTFILPDWGDELTFLYTAHTDETQLPPCAEGVLQWVPAEQVAHLPLWEGDRIFLPLLRTRTDCFSLKLIYEAGGRLAGYRLDGGEAQTCGS
ncbi:MAG: 8-oxo-dGTP diphosphatase [Clostridia bacterium]|jgi:8-oxo-dGTP diphosphatase|nr:8-oxo-dGTP diphosphatase [Clostridia bacterium]MBR4361081.1 8-oxo-dGTP diphosphatase [Clostridia bacterium]